MKNKFSQKGLAVAPSTTLEITARAAELKNSGVDLISFGTGEPDFDTPENIKQAAIQALEQGFTKYTATPGIQSLRAEIAKKLKRDNNLDYQINQIIVTNGGKQALYNALQAIIDDGEEVILIAPYWLSYSEMVKMAGGKIKIVHTKIEDGYLPQIQEVEELINEKTKAIIINSPCNPTGAVYPLELLEKLARLVVKNDLWIISDEIYEKLIYNGKKHISIASLNEEIFARTIVVNGFSKAYSMTGWRFGYTAASKELITIMTRIQSHQTSNINSITQKAGIEALTNTDISAMVEAFDKRRKFMVNYLKEMKDIDLVEPDGAFYVLLDMRKILADRNITAKELAKDLLEKKYVAVVPADDFGIEGHIRLSYPIDITRMEEGLQRIKEYLNK